MLTQCNQLRLTQYKDLEQEKHEYYVGVFGFCSLRYTLANTAVCSFHANTLLVLESPQNNKNSPSFRKFIATGYSQQPLDGVHMKYPTPCSNESAHTPIPGWRGSVAKVCTVLLLDLCAVLVAST